MFLYVFKPVPGSFVECDEQIDAEYWEGRIGETYQDFLEDKWVLLNQEQAAFHEAHPEANVKQVMDCSMVPPGEELEYAKKAKIKAINEYDMSDNVNCFYIGGNPMWLTVEEREQIATQISANEAIGREQMTKWFGGHEYTFPIATWKQMLIALEVYAGDALNVTEAHKAAINSMETVEEVEAFDITAGYPAKLNF